MNRNSSDSKGGAGSSQHLPTEGQPSAAPVSGSRDVTGLSGFQVPAGATAAASAPTSLDDSQGQAFHSAPPSGAEIPSSAANSAIASQADALGGPKTGEVVAGKYRLAELLGAGGMGAVFSAHHLELDRMVAVKFVHSSIFQQPTVAARFMREARAVVKIESEHVARVIDVGRLEDGTPFMVMEYLSGEDLSDVLARGALPVSDAVDYVIQACSAMSEAHAMGIVHRDLKPANLFLSRRRDGTPMIKVLDFGISKVEESSKRDYALTNPSMLMGSPAYMSPEQLKNAGAVDHRTDVWALGAILYELLAGHSAFDAESLPLLMTTIMHGEPLDLDEIRGDMPAGLADVIRQCLKKEPEQRFQSVAALVGALLPYAPRRSHWDIERISKAAGMGTAHFPSSRPHALSSTPPRSSASTAPSQPASNEQISTRGTSVVPRAVESGGVNVQETANSWVGEQVPSKSPSRGKLWVAALVFTLIAVAVVVAVFLPEDSGSAPVAASASGEGPSVGTQRSLETEQAGAAESAQAGLQPGAAVKSGVEQSVSGTPSEPVASGAATSGVPTSQQAGAAGGAAPGVVESGQQRRPAAEGSKSPRKKRVTPKPAISAAPPAAPAPTPQKTLKNPLQMDLQ